MEGKGEGRRVACRCAAGEEKKEVRLHGRRKKKQHVARNKTGINNQDATKTRNHTQKAFAVRLCAARVSPPPPNLTTPPIPLHPCLRGAQR